jgi:glycosyltransferase involved in cell wall biosynthesis
MNGSTYQQAMGTLVREKRMNQMESTRQSVLPRVDVIIPSFNYAHFLPGCVESVLSQQDVDVRVLILDDASTDNTQEVAQGLAGHDSRIEYRRHLLNRGHIATYNEGLEWASRDYTLLLSADDLLTPRALARASGVMDAHPEVVLTYGQEIKTQTPSPDQFVLPPEVHAKVLTGSEFVEACCRECDNIVPTPTALVRTSVQHRIGGYRKELPHAGDLEMWLRFGAHGSVAILDSQQAYYRLHPHNMSVHYKGIPDLVQRRAAFYTLFESYGHRLIRRRRLYELARRNLAWQFFWLAHRLFEGGDMVGTEKSLSLALETDPSLCYRPEWAKLLCKRLMGLWVWSQMRPLARTILQKRRPRTSTAVGLLSSLC